MFLIGIPAITLGLSALSLGVRLLDRRSTPEIEAPERGILRETSGPARWVVGRCRVGGLLAYYLEDSPDDASTNSGAMEGESGATGYRDAHLAIAISEGECDGVEAVWLDGRRYDLAAHGTESDGSIRYRAQAQLPPYASKDGDLFLVRACFSASGTQGAILRSLAGLGSGPFLEGISWIHLTLRQPPNAADRAEGWESGRLPDVDFLVRGVKPGGTWTDSAVRLRQWWEEEVKGATDLNAAALADSLTVGDEEIMTRLAGPYWRFAPAPEGVHTDPSGWTDTPSDPTAAMPVVWAAQRIPLGTVSTPIVGLPQAALEAIWQPPFPWKAREENGTIITLREIDTEPAGIETMYRPHALDHTVKRYSANGIIQAGTDSTQIDDEWDFCTQGALVHRGDDRAIEAGQDASAVLNWDADESTVVSHANTSGEDPVRGIQMSLAQSAPGDYLEASLPRITDGTEGPVRQLKGCLLVNHPIDGGRLMSVFRRRTQHNRRAFLSCMPHLEEVWNLRPGNVISLTYGPLGFASERCVVDAITFHPDLSVSLEFTVSPTGAYDDTITLPGEGDRPAAVLPPLVPAVTTGEGVGSDAVRWSTRGAAITSSQDNAVRSYTFGYDLEYGASVRSIHYEWFWVYPDGTETQVIRMIDPAAATNNVAAGGGTDATTGLAIDLVSTVAPVAFRIQATPYPASDRGGTAGTPVSFRADLAQAGIAFMDAAGNARTGGEVAQESITGTPTGRVTVDAGTGGALQVGGVAVWVNPGAGDTPRDGDLVAVVTDD